LALLVAFIFLYVRTADTGVVYKFRVMGVFCLAALAAPALTRIYDWNKAMLIAVLAIQLLPFCLVWYLRTPQQWGGVTERYYWQGAVLRHGNRSQEELYQWIRIHTPPTAILIDNKPYAPVFAQRSLFLARPSPGNWEPGQVPRDGWLFHPYVWLDLVNGHPRDEIDRRHEILAFLYDGANSDSEEKYIQHLDLVSGEREVFVVARNEGQKANLERRRFLQKVIDEGSWAVYELLKDNRGNKKTARENEPRAVGGTAR
jgi:hypothetical protein